MCRMSTELLKKSLETLDTITDTASDTLQTLAKNRETLEKIRDKTVTVSSDLDTARGTVRQIERRNKYWFLPSWLFR